MTAAAPDLRLGDYREVLADVTCDARERLSRPLPQLLPMQLEPAAVQGRLLDMK